MKLVVELPDDLVGRVRDAVENGGYDDAREFVKTAIENQLELEESGESASYKTLDTAIRELDQQEATSTTATDIKAEEPEPRREYDVALRQYGKEIAVEPPSADRVDDGPLWGQYNRLLPVKFVLRRLANVLHEKARDQDMRPMTAEHDAFSTSTALDAREFGENLEKVDQEKSRGRGEKLSSGFPTGDKKEKSLNRFRSHFVGYSDRNGKLTGASAALRFVDITPSENSEIGITEAGLEFAEMENPILDDSIEANDPLSKEEREFYIQYAANQVPAELDAMIHTAKAIEEGDDRPTSLTGRVAELNDEWSEAQASTNRSGLVSRMYELNLVDRFRVGQRGIGYEVTEDGHDLLKAYE